MFDGTIAGDGAVERMLLTGMAGDLVGVAGATKLPLAAIRSAISGDTLPYRAASELSLALDRIILKQTRLVVASTLLNADDGSSKRREAVDLGAAAARLYLKP